LLYILQPGTIFVETVFEKAVKLGSGVTKMKTTLRMFALLVAVAGLGAAAFVPASSQTQPRHASILVTNPASALPFPLPCQANGTCK
jgi:hypothetical protein